MIDFIPSLSVASKMDANINRDLRLQKVLALNQLDNDERLLTEKLSAQIATGAIQNSMSCCAFFKCGLDRYHR